MARTKYAYVLQLPDRPSFWHLVAWHLFGDQLMWAFTQGLEELRASNDRLRAENAALRSQISQRDASGRFAKKNAS